MTLRIHLVWRFVADRRWRSRRAWLLALTRQAGRRVANSSATVVAFAETGHDGRRNSQWRSGAILLAAGGTGGHLFPAEALAHDLIARGWDRAVLATDEPGASASPATFPASRDPSVVQFGDDRLGATRSRWLRAFWTLLAWRPRCTGRLFRSVEAGEPVAGFGGYPTLPPLYAATRRWRCRSLIHEQNAVMGRANKALAGRASNAIAGGFLPDHGAGQYASEDRSRLAIAGVGRRCIAAARHAVRRAGGGRISRSGFLVFGGSQGARVSSPTAMPPAARQAA